MSNTQNRKIGIIADSCCDLSDELKQNIDVELVPLIVSIVDGNEHIDDGTVDIPTLIKELSASKKGVKSSCPSVEQFAEQMRKFDECFVITISQKLSGSYNSACLAARLVHEENPEKKIHVFDSKAASCAETLIALNINDLINQGMGFDSIVVVIQKSIKNMETLFVLEDLGTLIKNGRMSKVTGVIASVLSMCPILTATEGEIQVVAKIRGIKQSIGRLVDIVAERTEKLADNSVRLVLTQCNCIQRGQEVKEAILEKCNAIKEVIMVSAGALTTIYANNGGIILSF